MLITIFCIGLFLLIALVVCHVGKFLLVLLFKIVLIVGALYLVVALFNSGWLQNIFSTSY